jgi:hypothetical protein
MILLDLIFPSIIRAAAKRNKPAAIMMMITEIFNMIFHVQGRWYC